MIPMPKSVQVLQGHFSLQNLKSISTQAQFLEEAQNIATILGLPAQVGEPAEGRIHFAYTPLENPEAYKLEVSSDRVIIAASGGAGLFYGVQTLRQLQTPASIEDAPRFAWRGSHLDVSRHFMSLEWIKTYVDRLAQCKMNVLHLHLTDDQGWRLEIKKYPRLSEIGAWRKKTRVGHELAPDKSFDDTPHGGYYTQEQLRELVEYAKKRHVTIVPEIEMPGHATAALAAYPEFGNTGIAPEVACTWGVFESVFAPTEATFAFLEDVLSEVLEIFPSRYIHIGGDECPKTEWKNSEIAQEVMRQNNLHNEEELQSYFVGRINRFLQSKNRAMIGWDEILEGGLTQGATVMSWRGEEGGITAAKAGHDVIMTPGIPTYFDHYQTTTPELEPLAIGGCNTLEMVYNYDPVPTVLSPLEAQRILGSQCQLWTEYMPTPKDVERMAFPRLYALAEVLWGKTQHDFADFQRRLEAL
ncbi:MAG: beta-N-acetylhexosaminidase [Deinococcales bacterium]